MWEPRTRAAAAGPDSSEPRGTDSTRGDHMHERTSGQRHAAGASAASTMCTDLRSPKHAGCSRYAGWNNGDSPGDVEPSQDIFWDPTSPTSGAAGPRNTRFVEISDIVNRIAPKEVKRKASPLLQWIGVSAVPCTQAVPKTRLRKRSSRQSSVDDLLKLARQFDENMQQDRETSERPDAGGDAFRDRADAPEPPGARVPERPPPSDPVEAELRALFDCSTQRVSGRLSSQGSSASARSPEAKRQPPPAAAGGSAPAAGRGSSNDWDDFEDDWGADDLLNDSFELPMADGRDRPLGAAAPAEAATVCTPPARPPPKPSALREACPKPKTSNRSTFRLQPNPLFRSAEVPGGTESAPPDPKPAAAKTPSVPIPGNADADGSWDDDGVDDALLCQVCDRVERTSDSQPPRAGPAAPRWVNAAATNRQSPRAFGRSNSLPEGGGGESGNYKGWDVSLTGGDRRPAACRSLPGSRRGLGSFNDPKPQTTFKRNVSDPEAGSSKGTTANNICIFIYILIYI
ncbi:Ewing's tumor-associated antigen 1 [Liparis tanakae]|uniref:Ewing's tumor-associated antigen 1 n=1 Tax=Liparis tanakae TaxID=230148 RepID=A0A4Z2ESY2_9TELE|nr:Ewing's tumor-associated antigen 1 [Liparis tanakae]